MKKFIKSLILLFVLIFIGVYLINDQTDLLSNFEGNFPEYSKEYPELLSSVHLISYEFSKIPSLSKLIGNFINEDMPVSPDDFKENAYIQNSPLLSFYDNESIGVKVENGNKIQVFGIVTGSKGINIAVKIVDENKNKVYETTFPVDSEYKFSKTIDIPTTKANKLSCDIYVGLKQYGSYYGWVNDYIKLIKSNGKWQLEKSPVYEQNHTLFTTARSTSKALKSTDMVDFKDTSISATASKICEGAKSDYEKILKFHDWICYQLRYDNDSISQSKLADYTASDVLESKKAVCIGFANLFAAFCRSQNIPCSVVTGYAIGQATGETTWSDDNVNSVAENHAWNEAYVDGRWIIVDTTWDTYNKYQNGKTEKGIEISHLYFDANIDFFSSNHRIMNYDGQ